MLPVFLCDIVEKIIQGITLNMTEAQRIAKLKANMDDFLKTIKTDGFTEVSIYPFFSSNQFYLIKYKKGALPPSLFCF